MEFGVDIVKDRRVQNRYLVASRHFEAPEVRLLIDAVQSARFITPAKSRGLVGFHDSKGIVAKFRVDRIEKLEVTEEESAAEPEGFDVSEYFAHEFSMLGGKECRVRLLCENVLMNSIIDGSVRMFIPKSPTIHIL